MKTCVTTKCKDTFLLSNKLYNEFYNHFFACNLKFQKNLHRLIFSKKLYFVCLFCKICLYGYIWHPLTYFKKE